jgi:hypothetical protein
VTTERRTVDLSATETDGQYVNWVDEAVDLAAEQGTVTWVSTEGKLAAVIVPVEAGEAYERWTGYQLAGQLQTPVAEMRRRVQDRLTEAGHPDMAALVPADPGILASYAGLLTDAEAGRKARMS